MACLADDLHVGVGFFSYSREDDANSHGALAALRTRIGEELRHQLGPKAKALRLWQNGLWQDGQEISRYGAGESAAARAVEQSIFFIPIVTPRMIRSSHCRFEFESFLKREAMIGRNDLIFPIFYIDVPTESAPDDVVIRLMQQRQYLDWRQSRHRDLANNDVRVSLERYCRRIEQALTRPWQPLVKSASTDDGEPRYRDLMPPPQMSAEENEWLPRGNEASTRREAAIRADSTERPAVPHAVQRPDARAASGSSYDAPGPQSLDVTERRFLSGLTSKRWRRFWASLTSPRDVVD